MEDQKNPKESTLALIDTQLKELYTAFVRVLGSHVSLFPVFDCPIEDQEAIMPLVFKNFHLPNLAPDRLYDITIGNAYFLVVPTRDFEPDLHLDAQTDEAFEKLSAQAYYRFVTGYNPVFPVTSTITNEDVRKAFWQVLKKNRVKAYFSFGEEVFNRMHQSGVWEIMTGGGGAPFEKDGKTEPFVHCVLLRIPIHEESNPIVQVLDPAGDVIDEFELMQEPSLLHELHITMAK